MEMKLGQACPTRKEIKKPDTFQSGFVWEIDTFSKKCLHTISSLLMYLKY